MYLLWKDLRLQCQDSTVQLHHLFGMKKRLSEKLHSRSLHWNMSCADAHHLKVHLENVIL